MGAVQFVGIWNGCQTVAEVSARTGKTEKGCRTQAWKLRCRGFDLKRFNEGPPTPPWKKKAEALESRLDTLEQRIERLERD